MRKFILYFLIAFSIFAVVASIAWFPSPLEAPFKQVKSWGGSGSNNGQFSSPADIVISSDNVFVCDTKNSRIQVFDLTGKYLRTFGHRGLKEQQLIEPVKLAVKDDQIYVLDKFNNSIKIYSAQGEFVDQIMYSADTTISLGGFTINLDNHVIATDTLNNRIVEFTKKGVLLDQWGIEQGQLNVPTELTIDQRGFIYIADTGNQRVQVINDKGDFILKWGAPFSLNMTGSFNGWFDHLTDITIGPDMTIYVVDLNNNRVQKFTSSGTFLTAFDFERNTKESNNFDLNNPDLNNPKGISIAVSATGDVYLADQIKNQIQVWSNKPTIK